MGTVEHARAMTIGMRTRSVSSVIFGFWRIWWLSGEAQFALFCFIIRNEHVVLWWFYYLLQLCKITYMYCSRVREGYQVNALKIILMNEGTIKATSNSACIIMWAHIFVPNVATRTNPVFQLSFYDHKNTKTQVWIKSDTYFKRKYCWEDEVPYHLNGLARLSWHYVLPCRIRYCSAPPNSVYFGFDIDEVDI